MGPTLNSTDNSVPIWAELEHTWGASANQRQAREPSERRTISESMLLVEFQVELNSLLSAEKVIILNSHYHPTLNMTLEPSFIYTISQFAEYFSQQIMLYIWIVWNKIRFQLCQLNLDKVSQGNEPASNSKRVPTARDH